MACLCFRCQDAHSSVDTAAQAAVPSDQYNPHRAVRHELPLNYNEDRQTGCAHGDPRGVHCRHLSSVYFRCLRASGLAANHLRAATRVPITQHAVVSCSLFLHRMVPCRSLQN